MAKNRYNNNTVGEVNETTTQPELTEVIGEDGMVDMVVNTDSTIDESTDVENVNQPDTVNAGNQEEPESQLDDSENIPSDENTNEDIVDEEKEPELGLPETQLEPMVENTPEVLKTAIPPIVEPDASFGPNINVLNDSSISIEDKIRWCLTEAPSFIKSLANQLFAYNETMKPKAPYNEQMMLNKQYELVSIYRSIFNVVEYKDFKVKFDVLNLFFAHFKDEGFAAQRLSRFDYLWKWSDVELTTLLHVSEVVSQLCLYAERVKRLKQLNLDMALDSTKTIVTEEARNNIIRYYKI